MKSYCSYFKEYCIIKSIFTILMVSSAFVSLSSQTFVKHDANGNNDGTTWIDAYTNMQVALDQSVAGDQIWVAAGTYVPDGPTPDSSHFVVNKAISLYGGFAGNESSFVERDFEANLTILSGDINGDDMPGNTVNRTDNAHHLVRVEALLGVSNIDGFILQSGTTRLDDIVGEDQTPWQGGAMVIRSETILRNCIFHDNDGYWAAALFVDMADTTSTELIVGECHFNSNRSFAQNIRITNLANPVFKECTFRNNQATGYGSTISLVNSNLTVEDCFFEDNSTDSYGGAITIDQIAETSIDSPSIHIKGSLFSGNFASIFGGAIALQNYIPGTELNIDSCEFINNTTSKGVGDGGAISILNYMASPDDESPNLIVRISESIFTKNSSKIGGGVLCASYNDSLIIEIFNTKFIENVASKSGGGLFILNKENSKTHIRLKGVDFDGNVAGVDGGGIYFDDYDNYFDNQIRVQYEMDSCLFQYNVANASGGAIVSQGLKGRILNSEFIENIGLETSGALDSGNDTLGIENCLFLGNYTKGASEAPYNGGAANLFWGSSVISMKNNVFSENISDSEGAAILIADSSKVKIENTLFNNHGGSSTILNQANINLVNTTMVDNELAIFQFGETFAEFQNTIFQSDGRNYIGIGNNNVESKGGNISNDDSLTDLLEGYGDYEDMHKTDPGLDMNYVPLESSPCIDKGNPDDIVFDFDLAGNDRIQGNQIDIGSFESPFTTAIKDARWNAPEVKVFPNPVRNILHFKIEDDWIGSLDVFIYDLLGRKVQEVKLNKINLAQVFQENVTMLSNGEYVLFISNADHTYASKIIVQH